MLAESVGLAMLVVLEMLGPPSDSRRAARHVALPFDEIAIVVDRSPEARGLASRARRVQAQPSPRRRCGAPTNRCRCLLRCRPRRDFDALVALLDRTSSCDGRVHVPALPQWSMGPGSSRANVCVRGRGHRRGPGSRGRRDGGRPTVVDHRFHSCRRKGRATTCWRTRPRESTSRPCL